MLSRDLASFIKTSFESLGLTESGLKYVLRVIDSPPSRNVVNVTKRNIVVDFPSQKMGHTLEFESVNPEAGAGLIRELDPLCIAHFLQPEKIPVPTLCKDGFTRELWKTPDALAIYPDRIELIECKKEEELRSLSMERPRLYARANDGRWYSPEATEALLKYGIKHVVVSSNDLNVTLLRNLSLLEEVNNHVPTNSALVAIADVVQTADDGISLADLIESGGETYGKNDVFFAILKRHIFFPIENCLLRDEKTTRLFSSYAKAEGYRILHFPSKSETVASVEFVSGTRFTWQNTEYKVCSVGPETLFIQCRESDPISISRSFLSKLVSDRNAQLIDVVLEPSLTNRDIFEKWSSASSSGAWHKACARAQFLAALALDAKTNPRDFGIGTPCARTISRWRRMAEESVRRYGAAYWGLIDKVRPGFPRDELPEPIRIEMKKVAEEQYFTPDRRRMRFCWRILRKRLEGMDLRCPCYKSFCKFLKSLKNVEETTRRREGERAAYKHSTLGVKSDENWISKDDYPTKVGQIDGKLFDIDLIDDETGENLGRPGVTTIILPNLGNSPIGVSVLFEKPSQRSAIDALRDMYNRKIAIPAFLMTDNGKEFNGYDVDRVLATLNIAKVKRPPSCPRFSSQIEGFFRKIDVELIHNLAGNTQTLTNIREMTKATAPDTRAVWTLSNFYKLLEKYLFETVWEAPSLSLGTSPRSAFERFQKFTPDTNRRFFIPPEISKIAFLSEVERKTRIVRANRGIFVGGYYYWNRAMSGSGIESTKVRVRYDPHDLYTVHAEIGNKWIECIATSAPELRNVTESNRKLRVLAVRRLRGTHAARREESHGRALGIMADQIQEDEQIMRENRRDRAVRALSKNKADAVSSAEIHTIINSPKLEFKKLRESRTA